MLLYNIDFEIAGIIVCILSFIFISIHYGNISSVKKFKKVIALNVIAASLDALTVVFYSFPGIIPDWLNYVINSACFLFGAWCSYAIVDYIKIYTAQRENAEKSERMHIFSKIVFFCYTLVLIANFCAPVVFYFDEGGNYIRTGIYPIVYVVPLIFIVYSNYFIVTRRKLLERRQISAIILYTVCMIIGMALQFFVMPDTFLSYFFAALAILSMTFTLETPEYIKLIQTMKELEAAKDEAENATKAKDNFLANMSHEIRTPLNSILGLDEIIIRESKDKRTLVHAKNIKSAGNALLAIINDILDLSKIESGKMELVNVEYATARVINDIANMTREKALSKGLKYEINISETFPSRLYGDEVRVRQVILNLVNNAIKYTHQGSVSVDVLFKRAEEPIGEFRNPVLLTINVNDTGIGIKNEDRDSLFENFIRLDEKKNRKIEGTGLGLALTKQFVEMMGGTINVISTYGKGSTFSVELVQDCVDETGIGNLMEARKNELENEVEFVPTLYAPKARILVVDDNDMNLQVFTELLEVTHIEIDPVDSGRECIRLCQKNKYDIIFLDRMMPEMDGLETMEIMKEQHLADGIPVVMLSADALIGSREKYLSMGFDEYMTKPVKYEDLERMIFKFLDKDKLEKMPRAEEESAENDNKAFGVQAQATEQQRDKSSLLVIDGSKEKLDAHKALLNGYKTTLVLDDEKAGRYMTKHDVDYVLISAEEYSKLTNPQ